MSAPLKALAAAHAAPEARFKRALYWLVALHILLATLGLQGCGGGETEEEAAACPPPAAASSPAGTKPTPRVDCTCNPGACL